MEGVKLQSPPCQECLDTFRENTRLVLGLAAVPGFSFLIMMQWTEAGTKAAIEVFGNEYVTKLPRATPDEARRHFDLCNEHMASIVSERSPLQHSNLEFATKQLEQLVMSSGAYAHGMFEGVLKTIVIQSWAAFEALTRMLWEKISQSGNRSVVLPTDKQWRKDQLGFGSRGRMRKTFDFAFTVDNAAIQSALHRAAIDPLAVLRNVIVHHVGRIDQDFKDHSDGLAILEPYRLQDLNTPIEVDGVLVQSVVDPAISSGYSLIRAIDNWITSHP